MECVVCSSVATITCDGCNGLPVCSNECFVQVAPAHAAKCVGYTRVSGQLVDMVPRIGDAVPYITMTIGLCPVLRAGRIVDLLGLAGFYDPVFAETGPNPGGCRHTPLEMVQRVASRLPGQYCAAACWRVTGIIVNGEMEALMLSADVLMKHAMFGEIVSFSSGSTCYLFDERYNPLVIKLTATQLDPDVHRATHILLAPGITPAGRARAQRIAAKSNAICHQLSPDAGAVVDLAWAVRVCSHCIAAGRNPVTPLKTLDTGCVRCLEAQMTTMGV